MSEINKNLEIVKIKEILDVKLTIPGYQRPYRWSTEAAATLVADLYSAFVNETPEYRIGTVVLHKAKGANSDIYNIVDGQQRLTTLSIMFFVFGELLGYDKFPKPPLLNEKYNELSCNAIVNNLDIIRRKVNEIDKHQLEGYVNYILYNCTIVKIITENEQEAFQFFDSQNSRGKELAPHDLLKSYHLREMIDEDINAKVKLINAWENTNQNELEDLFSEHLYPLVRWYKSMDGLNYSTKDIKTFKGIKKSNNYNFSVYNKAANLYIESFNKEQMYELTSGSKINQFQLTQPLIAGRRFFQYSLYYAKLRDEIEKKISFKSEEYNLVKSSVGDTYVYNMFVNVLMFYVDKFNPDALTDSRLFFFYKWAYSLRLCMKAVYRESVNRYALGKSDRVNKGLNMFLLIAEMQDPMELDTIILETVSEGNVINKKYKEMYDYIFGGDVNNDKN